MMRFGICSIAAGLLLLAPGLDSAGAAPGHTPAFSEVYKLLKEHATGMSDAELNRAAVQGLLAELGPRARLLTNGSPANPAAETPLVTQTRRFDRRIAYIRIARVGKGLAGKIKDACQRLAGTNALEGVVLDLRYADGDDYAAAVEAADLFASKAQPVLDWGNGMVSSGANPNAIRIPVAVLVNRDTAGAAEAVAAVLREIKAALILGGRTAGEAMVMQDYPLSGGGQLRIAVAPLTLGDGSALPAGGVRPDISVTVNPEAERIYYTNAFAVLYGEGGPGGPRVASANGTEATNLASAQPPLNEAELVREHRESLDRDMGEAPLPKPKPKPAKAAKPLVTDPVLARALDLIKGLTLVRGNHI